MGDVIGSPVLIVADEPIGKGVFGVCARSVPDFHESVGRGSMGLIRYPVGAHSRVEDKDKQIRRDASPHFIHIVIADACTQLSEM
jgi:hypothetical protein